MLQSWYFDTNFIVKAPLHYVNDKNWAVKSPHHNQCPPCPPPWHAEPGSRSAQCLQSPAQLFPGTLLTAPHCPLTACMTACMTAVTVSSIINPWHFVLTSKYSSSCRTQNFTHSPHQSRHYHSRNVLVMMIWPCLLIPLAVSESLCNV